VHLVISHVCLSSIKLCYVLIRREFCGALNYEEQQDSNILCLFFHIIFFLISVKYLDLQATYEYMFIKPANTYQ
jgi:hypothetical protein